MAQTDLSQIVQRMREARSGLERELADVSPEEASSGSSWAVIDLVRHLRGRPFYLNLAERIINGESVPPLTRPSPEEMWRRTVEQTLKEMDECITWVEGLKDEDLGRGFGEGAQAGTVRSLLEIGAAHYEGHLEQLRREIKPALRPEGTSS
ncbi:MAG: DinB family protein [Dehalococcoidia bacterium]